MFNMKPPKRSVCTIVVRNPRGEVVFEETVSAAQTLLPLPEPPRERPVKPSRWSYWTVGGKKPSEIQGTNAMTSKASNSAAM
jgi:hypothetical protein